MWVFHECGISFVEHECADCISYDHLGHVPLTVIVRAHTRFCSPGDLSGSGCDFVKSLHV
jgi:hypothetical protein